MPAIVTDRNFRGAEVPRPNAKESEEEIMANFNQPVTHRESVQPTGPTSFIGKVKVVIFERGLFRILAVRVEETNFEWDQEEITVKGQLGDVVEGDRYEFEGRVVDDKRYGLQFASTGAHVVLPQNPAQLATFVKFHGVHLHAPKKSSQAVFKALGDQAMKQVTDDPNVLKEVEGFGIGDQQRLIDFFTRLDFGNTTGKIIQQLKGYGLSERLVNLIFDHFGVQTLTDLTSNPYCLAQLADAELPFRRVDELAQQHYQVAALDPRRLQAAILVAARELTARSGDSHVADTVLLQFASRLVAGIDPTTLVPQLRELLAAEKLNLEGNQVYPAALYQAEQQIADCLHNLLTDSALKRPSDRRVTTVLDEIEAGLDYDYDAVQREAITKALQSPVLLLTGGPGTGKTTIVKGIVKATLALDKKAKEEDILLVAPTGRAAKQVARVTGLAASTIHRLLGLTAEVTAADLVSQDVPELEGKLLIVDEMSMTDLALFATLIRAVGPATRVVLVGDFDQLPSVGPGQVFRDLLAAAELPQIRLTKIHRQAADSSLIPLAQKINAGEVSPALFAPADPNRYPHRRFFHATLPQVATVITQAVQLYHDRHGLSLMDIQILAPVHAGLAGTQNLNAHLQAALTPEAADKPEVVLAASQRVFRVGDKVMQTVNDPDRDVFNGDLGIIQSIEGTNARHTNRESKAALKVIVDFDGTEVEYTRPQDVGALQLAYCMTIHKSQGSQAPVVILPMVEDYFPRNPAAPTIMRRNLLYTAVTRAARALMLVGDPTAFVRCAATATNYRQTTLTERIEEAFGKGAGEQSEPRPAKRTAAKPSPQPAKPAPVTENPTAGEDSKGDPNLTTGADPLPFDKSRPQPAKPAADPSPVPTPAPATDQGLTPELAASGMIDPLIGMEGVAPSDF